MLRNVLLTTLRHLRRRRSFAVLNISGLAVGLAGCLLIGLYIRDEARFDRFHEHARRIVRIVGDVTTSTETIHGISTAGPLAPALERDFPQVEHAVRLLFNGPILIEQGERRFVQDGYVFADSTIFDVFSFDMLQGDPRTALVAPDQIVLSASTARKFFGDDDPIGRTLRLENTLTATVSGVFADLPRQSHLDIEVLVPLSFVRENGPPPMLNHWLNVNFSTYALLAEGADPADLEAALPAFIERYAGEAYRQADMEYRLVVEPLTDLYLRSERDGPAGGRIATLRVFALVGGFMLLLACINFMNLATARSAERAREIGVRKVVGARREALVGQFLGEALLLSLLAAGLALLLAELALPVFRMLSGKPFAPVDLVAPQVIGTALGLAVLAGLLAGSYPALVLSGFRPAVVLKGGLPAGRGGLRFRQVLVVVQFGISVVLIVGTLVVYAQLHYMQRQHLGFQKEQMLVVELGGDGFSGERMETLRRTLEALPAVEATAASRSVPGTSFPEAYTQIQASDGTLQVGNLNLFTVDEGFLDAYHIDVVAGRGFDPAFATDLEEALLINEAAARRLGYASPEAAVGARFEQWGREGVVVGVVDDFHYYSLQTAVEPLTLRLQDGGLSHLTVRLAPGDMRRTLADLEATWKRLVPERPFDYEFLDAAFDAQYRSEVRFGRLFAVFAGLALFIACLGLFGLASFMAQQRTKEIGVRKVLGASARSLVLLLTRDFVKLVGVAFVLAAPPAYLAMDRWLADFDYRTDVGAGVFLTAGGLALGVAVLAVGYQALRAARTRPAKALRYE